MTDDPFAATDKGLIAKTGKGLAHWVGIANGAGIEKHMDLVKYLKEQHGLGHGHANTVVHAAKQSGAVSQEDDELLAAMFAGPKTGLKPVYDKLAEAAKGFGSDVEFAPKKAYVSLRRSKQFAILQPSTKTRFDLGLNLKGDEPDGKLEAAGSWNAMCTHRVRLESDDEVDDAVIGWLRAAYDRA